MKKLQILKLFITIGVLVSIFIIFVNSSIDLYLKKDKILTKLGIKVKEVLLFSTGMIG